ncbi:unnamed protein product, partial [Brassica napus]
CYVLLPRLRAWPPRASCLKLKTPFSEPHLPLPPCLIEVDKKDFVVVNSGWKREKNIRVGQLEKRK